MEFPPNDTKLVNGSLTSPRNDERGRNTSKVSNGGRCGLQGQPTLGNLITGWFNASYNFFS